MFNTLCKVSLLLAKPDKAEVVFSVFAKPIVNSRVESERRCCYMNKKEGNNNEITVVLVMVVTSTWCEVPEGFNIGLN